MPASNSAPALLIIEPDFTGHRWRYVEWAMQAFAEAGHRCVVVTDSANHGHRLAQALAAGNYPGCKLLLATPAPDAGSGAGRLSYIRYWRVFHDMYQQACATLQPTLAVVPYADYFLYALPVLGSPFAATPWIGITMRASFHHASVGVRAPRQPVVNTAKALLFRAALRTDGLRTLLSIDPTLPQWHAGRRGGAALGYLADPSPDATGTGSTSADDARARLRLGSGPHLLVYGDVSARKGIRELVGALSGHPRAPTLVIAGVQDAETRDYLRAATSALAREPVVLDRFITETEEADLFAACDAVWLGYKGHYGMSGVLVQAYRSGKPVVATADGLIGWFCNGRELGPVLEDLSAPAIRRALDQLWPPPSPGAPSAPSPGVPGRAHLLARHTVGEFKRTLLSAAA
ncbi:glycosyltransferase [Cupriavidus numazuensis]|uniref:Glycosyltransferase n=1 Tax=Cupriavidus numazuensis TaxID=221992 RepID=A0ABN7QCX5_9BURK|nr:glycosyltransferase [Cupriavidus numazuensis]CAG2159878.1 hypothetical protein LMG26411_07050 [Cupriavidus numazuensis]